MRRAIGTAAWLVVLTILGAGCNVIPINIPDPTATNDAGMAQEAGGSRDMASMPDGMEGTGEGPPSWLPDASGYTPDALDGDALVDAAYDAMGDALPDTIVEGDTIAEGGITEAGAADSGMMDAGPIDDGLAGE